MDISALKHQIITNTLEHLYIFTGDEIAVCNIYIKQISKIANLPIMRCDSVLDVFKQIKNKSLLAVSNHIYIVSNDKAFVSNFESYTELNTVLNDSILILSYDSIDMRSKFYKTNSEKIVKFEKLSRDILIKYIQKEINLTYQKADILAEVCDDDYSRILLEIDKIYNFAVAKDISPDSAFITLATEGVIYSNPYDAIFDFADAVLDRDYTKSFTLLRECKDNGEAALIMLSVLYTNFKQTLQVQSCTGDVAKITGLTKWQINKANAHRGKYRNGEIVKAMRILSDIVEGIKLGKINDDVAIDIALVNIL